MSRSYAGRKRSTMSRSYAGRKRSSCFRSNWSDLPLDLLDLIALKIQFVQDVFSFQRVCRSWRYASESQSFAMHKHPMLLLSETTKEGVSEKRMIPFGYDHKGFATEFYKHRFKTWCLGWKGWILVFRSDCRMYMIHAFYNDIRRIKLPYQPSLKTDKYDRVTLYKAALSSNPLINQSDYTLMVLYYVRSMYNKRLAFWRPGDKCFTRIPIDNHFRPSDIIFHKGLFHAITNYGVVVFDLAGPKPSYELVGKAPTRWNGAANYLVELHGELVVVVGRSKFKVFVVSKSCEWSELHDLGKSAIFIGGNTSFSVNNASEIPGLMPNHIYFTNDYPKFKAGYSYKERKHMGTYNLTTQKVEYLSCNKEELSCCSHPPLWIQPAFP